jgi:phytoene synthase
VVSTSSDPRLGAIRLAWWRERLEQLDEGLATPGERRLQAVASELLPRAVAGLELSQLEDAWLPLLAPFPRAEEQADALRQRGRILFGIGARLLGARPESSEAAGAFWSLSDGAQHCSDDQSRRFLTDEARRELAALPRKAPGAVRGLTILSALTAADLVREGRPAARLAAAIRHRLLGTFPR